MAAGEDVAVFLIKSVAAPLIGDVATKYIGGPLFSALGISMAPDGGAYSAQVTDAITQLGAQVSAEIAGVQAGVKSLSAITLQIQDYAEVEGLSEVLRNFNEQATVISTLFNEFQSDVAFLSQDATKNAAALTDLYTRLMSPNDTNVATAMNNIYQLVIPPTAGDRGIFDYLTDVLAQKVTDSSRTAMATAVTNSAPTAASPFNVFPTDMNYCTLQSMYTAAPAAVSAEMETVVSVMQRILTAQIQGLMFLDRAWSGGPQAATLATYTNQILGGIQVMQLFFYNSHPAINRALLAATQQFGVPMSGAVLQLSWLGLQGLHNVGQWLNAPIGLSPDWVVWDVESNSLQEINLVFMVEKPWEGNVAFNLIFDIEGYSNGGSFLNTNPQRFTIPPFSGAPPASLNALIGALPSSPAQLQARLAASVPVPVPVPAPVPVTVPVPGPIRHLGY